MNLKIFVDSNHELQDFLAIRKHRITSDSIVVRRRIPVKKVFFGIHEYPVPKGVFSHLDQIGHCITMYQVIFDIDLNISEIKIRGKHPNQIPHTKNELYFCFNQQSVPKFSADTFDYIENVLLSTWRLFPYYHSRYIVLLEKIKSYTPTGDEDI